MTIANEDSTNGTSNAQQAAQQRSGALHSVLWVLVALGAIGNVASQTMGLNIMVSIGFGVLTLAGATWLVVDHYRRRQQ